MPRREHSGVRVVHRTARIRLRTTPAQRRRCYGRLLAAGDVWAACLDMNRWRLQRGLRPIASYQELCRELSAAGPGTFGESSTVGARSVLRRYSDAWFATAQRRRAGESSVRYPRRKSRLMPVRFHEGRFRLDGRRLALPTARGRPPLVVRLVREMPYPAEHVRSVTLLADGGSLWIDVTAEVPVPAHSDGQGPDPSRIGGVDLGVIHPYAVSGPEWPGPGRLRAGDPRRTPPASPRPGPSKPRHDRTRSSTRTAGLAALAQVPRPRPQDRGPSSQTCQTGSIRGVRRGGRLGAGATDRHVEDR